MPRSGTMTYVLNLLNSMWTKISGGVQTGGNVVIDGKLGVGGAIDDSAQINVTGSVNTSDDVDVDGAIKSVSISPHTVTADIIIKLLDAGANVSLKDKDDNEIFKFTANGMWQINAGSILRMNGSTLEVRDPTNTTMASLYIKFLYALSKVIAIDGIQSLNFEPYAAAANLIFKLRNDGYKFQRQNTSGVTVIETSSAGNEKTIDPTYGGCLEPNKKFPGTTGAMSGASSSIAVNIADGAKTSWVLLKVKTEITSGDGATSWDAVFAGGSTTAICSGKAFAQNTYVKVYFEPKDAVSGSVATITITPDSGNFSGGEIVAVAIADVPVELDDFL